MRRSAVVPAAVDQPDNRAKRAQLLRAFGRPGGVCTTDWCPSRPTLNNSFKCSPCYLHSQGVRLLSALTFASAVAGLQHLSVTIISGRADVVLSRKWAGFEQLTDLVLSGMRELRQESGHLGGALHDLFQHLKVASLQVGCLSTPCASPIFGLVYWHNGTLAVMCQTPGMNMMVTPGV